MYPTYQGLPIVTVQTRRGQKNVLDEMVHHGIDLDDAAEILDRGFACHRSKRRVGVIERCIHAGQKTIKVVAQRGVLQLDGQECWEIIHVGSFSERRKS